MSLESAAQKITEWLDHKLAEPDWTDLFVVELSVVPGPKVTVYLDGDTGISIGRCSKISRMLEAYLDESKLIGEAYRLDVSSPGVSRPLQSPRQYPQHVGRTLAVTGKSPEHTFEGTLVEAGPEGIVLEREEKIAPEGKKKKELVVVRREIPYEHIQSALVKPAW
jgi:ribosome maturation factor RimP